ncbi:MAG: hypothetical protein AAGI91_02670 [Bacteroidota bacterium]
MLRLLPLALLLVLAGCDSDDDTSILRAPGGQTPVAGAIDFRGENNEDLGLLGSGPVGGYIGDEPSSGRTRIFSLFPNPTARRTALGFAFEQQTEAAVFVVAALPPGSMSPPQASDTQGAWVYRPGGLPLAVLARRTFEAGAHSVDFEFTEVEGRPLPEGYYRIYLQTPDFIAWQDMLYDPTLPLF